MNYDKNAYNRLGQRKMRNRIKPKGFWKKKMLPKITTNEILVRANAKVAMKAN